MRLLAFLTLGILSYSESQASSTFEAYQHGHRIAGVLKVTDLKDPKCKLKNPNEQLIVFLEEKSDFLISRGVRSSLGENGEFFFPVESRYVDYRFVIMVMPSSFVVYEKTLHAYNAPATYNLTLSCVNDMKMWITQ